MKSPETKEIIAKLLKQPVKSIKRIGQGRNSRVYLADCQKSERYAIKFYPAGNHGTHNRLQTEYSALTFLWKHGIRRIPEPVIANPSYHCAAYRHLEGIPIQIDSINNKDVQETVEFLVELNRLCSAEGSQDLPPAADACFSDQELLENIEARADKLRSVPDISQNHHKLLEFLATEFNPKLDVLRDYLKRRAKDRSEPLSLPLDRKFQTFSPSDFGFHNAIRQPNGTIAFLDFEYFGWDDPAKTVCDFLLHPAMELRMESKQIFLSTFLEAFSSHDRLTQRAKRLYPLYCLKWCMILLNGFLPDYLRQRDLNMTVSDFQEIQLGKSRKMLKNTEDNNSGLFNCAELE